MNRLTRVLTALNAHSVKGSLVGGICATAAELLDSDGSGLALLSGGGLSTICVYGAMAEIGEELQFTLGEGPSRDAMAADLLIESDRLPTDRRWPVFAAEMERTSVLSVASFPVRIGGARVGALTTYRELSARLSADQAADGYVLARIAAHAILAAQVNTGDADLMAEMESGFTRMESVHQATGMIMGQLRVGPEQALARLRSTAFATGTSIIDVAQDVVAGRTVLSEDSDHDI